MRLSFLILLFPATALFSETILMQNGTYVRGNIIAQDRTSVTIDTATGRLSLQKATIKRIMYDDAKFDAEQKAREEGQRRQEAKNAEERRLAEEKRQAALREESKNKPDEPPGLQRTGPVLGVGLSTNRYSPGTIDYTKREKENPLGVSNLPSYPANFRTRGYGGLRGSLGYQSRKWFILVDVMQIHGHSKYDELGGGYTFLQSPNPQLRLIDGRGAANSTRTGIFSRAGFSPVPATWFIRPHLYAGYSSTNIQTRLVSTTLNYQPGVRNILLTAMRANVNGKGPELGGEIRFLRESGLELRTLYGQSWQRGHAKPVGNTIAFRAEPASSLLDNLWIRSDGKGDSFLRVQRYAATMFSPRLGVGRAFFSLRAEHSVIHVHRLVPIYTPITQLSLLQSGISSSLLPDLIFKYGKTSGIDDYKSYEVGYEVML